MIDIDTIAATIHETWRARSATQGRSIPPHLDRSYADLSEADKDDNRAAARRMGDVLGAAGLALRYDALVKRAADDVFAAAMETMAEAEHDGWMAQRTRDGWTWGKTRDDAAKRHPSMIPYACLPENEKEKDRGNVRQYAKLAARAGYRIVSAR